MYRAKWIRRLEKTTISQQTTLDTVSIRHVLEGKGCSDQGICLLGHTREMCFFLFNLFMIVLMKDNSLLLFRWSFHSSRKLLFLFTLNNISTGQRMDSIMGRLCFEPVARDCSFTKRQEFVWFHGLFRCSCYNPHRDFDPLTIRWKQSEGTRFLCKSSRTSFSDERIPDSEKWKVTLGSHC